MAYVDVQTQIVVLEEHNCLIAKEAEFHYRLILKDVSKRRTMYVDEIVHVDTILLRSLSSEGVTLAVQVLVYRF